MPSARQRLAEREMRAARRHPSRSRRDIELARVAANAQGVVDLGELRACGIGPQATARRVRTGRLHPLHEGVYAVGHPGVSRTGRFVAATKACGPAASLSHRAQASELEIVEWKNRDIEVTVWDGVDNRHSGVEVHRSSLIKRSDCVIRNGILVTNAHWTVVALASVVDAVELRGALRQALAERLVSLPSLLRLLDRLGPIRGSRVLRMIIARAKPTRSELEDRVLEVIRWGGIEIPEVNEPLLLEGRVVIPDFRWPERRLVLEADSDKWHGDPLARADDLERQALLERHGDAVLRTTWSEVVREPRRLVKRLGSAGAP